MKAHELDDGATEVIENHPRRRPPAFASVAETASKAAGGRLTQAETPASDERHDYVNVRTQLGAAKITLGHLHVFSALWRIWAAKRVNGVDGGVTVADLTDALQRTPQAVRTVVATLIRNNIIRSVRTNVGWANVRASYYPTELGTQILALTQALGPGASVQIGRTATAWSSRSDDEPENFFRHAAFLRAG